MIRMLIPFLVVFCLFLWGVSNASVIKKESPKIAKWAFYCLVAMIMALSVFAFIVIVF